MSYPSIIEVIFSNVDERYNWYMNLNLPQNITEKMTLQLIITMGIR